MNKLGLNHFSSLLFLCWIILSNLLSFYESGVIYRFWQISIILIFIFGLITCYSKFRILKGKTIILIVFWSCYINLVNLFTNPNSPFNYLDVFIDTNWWVIIFILAYSIFIDDNENYYFKKLLLVYPYIFLVSFSLVAYKMIFFFGSFSQGIIQQNDINSIFWVLLLLPFAFLGRKSAIKYLILFMTLILVIISSKRSAIIAFILILVFMFSGEIFNGRRFLKNLLKTLILILFLYLLFDYTISIVDVNVLSRFQETNLDEEARFDFITESWNIFSNKPIGNILFGSGHRSSGFDRGSDLLSKTTHNDFFEVLYNYGIIGFCIYVSFIFRILSRCILLKNLDRKLYDSLIASLIIFFVISMVSHLIIYPTYFSFLIIIWAMAESKIYNYKKSKNLTYI